MDRVERKMQKMIYAFIMSVIIIVAAFAVTIYYYETKEISKGAVGEGLFAKAFVDENIGAAPLGVDFSSLLFNFEGTPRYHWDFGDGNTSNETNPTHNYTEKGEYICNLTVTDVTGENVTTSVKISVTVNNKPTVVALVSPTKSPRPDRPFWLIKLNGIPFIGDQLLVALAESDSSLVKGEGWISCEAQPSDPEGDEIVWYEWELQQPPYSTLTGTQEWPKFNFSGENLTTITFPPVYTFRRGQYDVKVTVTDAAGNKASSQVRFNVEISNFEGMRNLLDAIWNGMWGVNFQQQPGYKQELLIKIWTLLGPAQTVMNNMVEKILAPLPENLSSQIYGIYSTLVWEQTNRKYHKPNSYAPTKPSDPTPVDNKTGVSTLTNLSWSCSDPDGDQLSYDIYFGTSSPPPQVRSDYKGKTYDLEEQVLIPGTKYYWKIVVTDVPASYAYGGSKTVEGSIWSFTTEP